MERDLKSNSNRVSERVKEERRDLELWVRTFCGSVLKVVLELYIGMDWRRCAVNYS